MGKKSKLKKKLKNNKITVFKQFKKQKIFSQISFVFAALVIGFGINSYVLNGQYGSKLKTSVLDINKVVEKKSNIYIEKDGDSSRLNIKIGKEMKDVKSLSLSIMYNSEEIKIKDIFSKVKGTKLSKIENEEGVATLILSFEKSKNLKAFSNIIEFYAYKTTEKTTQNINIINSNFTNSTGKISKLNTSGITF